MGLFSSDESYPRAETLVENARHDSVSKEVLTEISTGFLGGHDYLSENPVIEYLEDDEQPHFVFSLAVTTGASAVEVANGDDLKPSKKLRIMVTITDQRILLVIGDSSGDWTVEIPYADITGIELEEGEGFDSDDPEWKLHIETAGEEYTIIEEELSPTGEIPDRYRKAFEYLSNQAPV